MKVSAFGYLSNTELILVLLSQPFLKQARCYRFPVTAHCHASRLAKEGNDIVHPRQHRPRHPVFLRATVAKSTNAHFANNRSEESRIGSDTSKLYTSLKKNGFVHLTSRRSYQRQEYPFVLSASKNHQTHRISKTATGTKSASTNLLPRKHSTERTNYSNMLLKSTNNRI
jgi:hypothetical protein